MPLQPATSVSERGKRCTQYSLDDLAFDAVVVVADEVSHAAYRVPVCIRFERFHLTAKLGRGLGDDQQLTLNRIPMEKFVAHQGVDAANVRDVGFNPGNCREDIGNPLSRPVRRQSSPPAALPGRGLDRVQAER